MVKISVQFEALRKNIPNGYISRSFKAIRGQNSKPGGLRSKFEIWPSQNLTSVKSDLERHRKNFNPKWPQIALSDLRSLRKDCFADPGLYKWQRPSCLVMLHRIKIFGSLLILKWFLAGLKENFEKNLI